MKQTGGRFQSMRSSVPSQADLPRVYTLTSYLGCAFEIAEPIVDGLIHLGELVLLTATAKTGKSLIVLSLAIQAARGLGERFLGQFAVTQTRVLIIQTEISQFRYQQRLIEMLGAYTTVPLLPDLLICTERIKIDTEFGRKTLTALIETHQPKLLILDPFYCLHNCDEDKQKEISPVLTWLKQVVLKYNIACLLVHHQGKRGETDTRQVGHRSRGSSAFGDVPDGTISLQRTSTEKQATISFEMRNTESPNPLTLQLDEHLWWRSLGTAKDDGTPRYSIDDILENEEMIPRATFIERFMSHYGRKERRAETFIQEMVAAKKITKVSDKDGLWIFRNNSSATPQLP